MTENADLEKYRFIFKTVQSTAFKTLIEGLKDINIDINLKIDQEGIHMTSLDGNQCTITNLNLIAKSFELFHCAAEITIGINLKSLHMILKTIGNNDVITMYIEKNNITRLNIVNENKEKNTKEISKLKLLDLNYEDYTIPDIEFDFVIKMPSNDFQAQIKNLSNFSDIVTIKNLENQFIMSVDGDVASKDIILGETVSTEFNKINTDNFSGDFDIRFLLLFIKNSNLCSNVELFLKKNHPLILVYSVASLGSLKLVLAPKI